jgi:hypothetical protein
VLGWATVVWLAVSAVASLNYAACFLAAPQLISHEVIIGATCLMPENLSPEEQVRRRQECGDAGRRDALHQERRRCMRGMLVFGSMLIVSAVLLRRERKRAAV